MNLTPTAWYGILAAIAAVIAAYFVGFNAGREHGRSEGFSDGRREGAKEGSARGYAVGYDRGRRKQEQGDESPAVQRPAFLFILIGLILAGGIVFSLAKMERGRVEPRGPNIEGPIVPRVPIEEPSIDR